MDETEQTGQPVLHNRQKRLDIEKKDRSSQNSGLVNIFRKNHFLQSAEKA